MMSCFVLEEKGREKDLVIISLQNLSTQQQIFHTRRESVDIVSIDTNEREEGLKYTPDTHQVQGDASKQPFGIIELLQQ